MVIDMFKFMKKEKNRRDFFEDSLRVILGSGLAVLSVVLGSRKENPNSAEPCQLSLPCNDCSQLSGCKKEQAAGARILRGSDGVRFRRLSWMLDQDDKRI